MNTPTPSNTQNKNFNLQSYVDVRIVAALLRFYQRKGLLPTDKRIRMSDVIRQSLELLHDRFKKQGLTEITSTEEAVAILRDMGLATDQLRSASRPLIKSLQLEALEDDITQATQILTQLTPEQQAAALKVEKEILSHMGRKG